jgi:hypothetical protein
MRKLAAIVCGLFLLGVGITATLKAPQEYLKDRSITSLAQRTKNQGNTQVTVPGKIIEYPGMNMSLDEALQSYSAVIAEPIESKSYISDSSDEIRTAYKFRIIETLSQKNAVNCSSCPQVTDVSAKLQPALYNEFLLELSGGTVVVDGVEVTMASSGIPKFEDDKKYLMFISLTPGGMARLAGGPSGLFRVMSDDSLEALGKDNTGCRRRLPRDFRRVCRGLGKRPNTSSKRRTTCRVPAFSHSLSLSVSFFLAR